MTDPPRRARPRSRRGWWALVVILAVIAVLSAGGAVYQAIASARERELYPPPGELVDVGGLRLHIRGVT